LKDGETKSSSHLLAKKGPPHIGLQHKTIGLQQKIVSDYGVQKKRKSGSRIYINNQSHKPSEGLPQ
jgi:hypothetical protein